MNKSIKELAPLIFIYNCFLYDIGHFKKGTSNISGATNILTLKKKEST